MPAFKHRDLRSEILNTAWVLFVQLGYLSLSMRQIAESVGVSKPAVYYHFRNKEELFLAVILAYLDEMEALFDHVRSEGGTARQQILTLGLAIFSQAPEQRGLARVATQELHLLREPTRQAIQRAYQEKFIDKIKGILEEGIQRGELLELDPAVSTWALLGMIYPFLSSDFSPGAPTPEKAGQVLSIFLDGLARNP